MADDDLIKERVRRWVGSLAPEQRRKPTIFFMDGRTFTPEQVVKEIEEDTPVGRTFRRAEELMLERTLQRKRQAGLGV